MCVGPDKLGDDAHACNRIWRSVCELPDDGLMLTGRFRDERGAC